MEVLIYNQDGAKSAAALKKAEEFFAKSQQKLPAIFTGDQ